MKQKFVAISLFVLAVGLIIPAIASDKADTSAQDQAQIQEELKAMKERGAQTKCPISGQPVADAGYTFMGYEIKTCCPNCVKKVEEDPISAIFKIRMNGEEPKLAADIKAQEVCPVSGKPVNQEVSSIKANMMMTFCCPNCKAKFEENPKETAKKLIEKGQAPILLTMAQKNCPISGHPASESVTVQHNGKEIMLCCEGCKAPFNETPEKYLQAMADKGIVLKKAAQ